MPGREQAFTLSGTAASVGLLGSTGVVAKNLIKTIAEQKKGMKDNLNLELRVHQQISNSM